MGIELDPLLQGWQLVEFLFLIDSYDIFIWRCHAVFFIGSDIPLFL